MSAFNFSSNSELSGILGEIVASKGQQKYSIVQLQEGLKTGSVLAGSSEGCMIPLGIKVIPS